ncbi:diaminobutyrate acetyltransferase [Marinobacterium arenosum]|uniref:diaminobutyrate acetyltransferase n=1 Tax=Marinobacterium arenosum TaxID=2862496 RepID=UPI001C97D952|nr:diaminobutyrate acetyltransferase [Marinobacterium arenosum]MBY4677381.1 diaminobutyrate acetyltransferase [Marinobacterium arenosum]
MNDSQTEQVSVQLRAPVSADGAAVHRLVAACPPLDGNSMYCNLLQCSHMAETSVAALSGDQLVGFISGYRLPERPDTLFIWQVAVGEQARGQGLASRMLHDILQRPQCQGVSYLETTITEANGASWALFERLARSLGAELNRSVLFDRQTHFDGEHATEMLVRIGPFQ